MAAPPRLVGHPDYATVKRTIIARNQELIDRYGAHHIGVSKKVRRGRRLPETCITFYVMRKQAAGLGTRKIPKRLELEYGRGARRRSVLTDVCEIKRRPTMFSMRGGNLVTASNGQNGTVGMVFRQGGNDFFLTNAHVAADPGSPAGQMRVSVPGVGTVLGDVVRMDDLDAGILRSDAALVSVAAGSVAPGQFLGVSLVLDDYGEIAMNDPRRFFYVAGNFVHALRWSGFGPAATPIQLDGFGKHCADYHTFDVVVGQTRRGHSGAVVFCESGTGLRAVGLLFGGIVAVNQVWVFPIRLCLARMGIDPDSL